MIALNDGDYSTENIPKDKVHYFYLCLCVGVLLLWFIFVFWMQLDVFLSGDYLNLSITY